VLNADLSNLCIGTSLLGSNVVTPLVTVTFIGGFLLELCNDVRQTSGFLLELCNDVRQVDFSGNSLIIVDCRISSISAKVGRKQV
jgi:hypothetical protein